MFISLTLPSASSKSSDSSPLTFFLTLFILTVTPIGADIAVISPTNRTVDVFIDIELKQASPIPFEGLIGRVVHANPENACSPIDPPPHVNNSYKWFVLIKGFSCQYQQVRYAMKAGYSAAIIYNSGNRFSSAPHTQFDTGINIPAVLISSDDGWTIKKEYQYSSGYFLMIIPDMQFNINAYLLPFAIVIGVCLILMTSFMIFQIVKCIRDRRRRRRHRLTSRHLKQIPTTKYKKGDQYDTCAICLEEYVEGEKLRILPCGHAYHIKCIDPWLTKNRRVCPVCKGKVILPGMSDVSDTDSEDNHGNASERTPLLEQQRQTRQRQNRRRHRSYPQSNSGPSSRANEAVESEEEAAPSETTPLVMDCSASAPNVTLVEADIVLPPNNFSVNCDYDGAEAANEVGPRNSNESRRTRRQGIIV